MSYKPAIPQGTDTTLQSQAQIRANFQAINTVFANNHYPLTGNNEFQGTHRVLTMRAQGVDPVTDATHIAFYNKLVAGVPQLFFAPNNAQTPIQLTYSSLSTGASLADQYSFVAGPFIVYGGFISNPSIGQVVNLTPISTLIYVGLTTAFPEKTGAVLAAIPTNIAGSSFTINYEVLAPGGSLSVYYLAIGKP